MKSKSKNADMNHKVKMTVVLLIICALSSIHSLNGQDFAIKTNLAGEAILSPNLGLEVGLSPRLTLDASAGVNAWTLSGDRRWKHWYVQPGVRRWFCDRFSGHFIGIHVHGGQYNVGGIDIPLNMFGSDFRKLKDGRYQGWFAGGGVSYGYAWILGRHWNLEAELGLGYSYTRYDKFPCASCGTRLETDASHHYVGPTKVSINLVYTL